MAADPHRLPSAAAPTSYDLELSVDVDAGTFAGHVTVTLTVADALAELVCNALDLELDGAWVDDGAGGRVAATVTLDKEAERAHIALARALEPGRHELHVDFRGELNDKLVGFYRSTFTDDAGAERSIAVTQFEATHARRAFPCWDEPERKATLRLTLDVPAELTAVANALVVSDEPSGEGRRRLRFAETMAMSTYLYAWVVGPVEATAAVPVDGIDLRVVHVPGKADLTAFALESGAFGLRWLADYYGSPYPGDKCDLVAVPDFAFGAMENLGCITFREAALLVDPERATQPELQRIADVIHHELAHMWFGDLVTMRWWNGIWLNEAFATFMEMKCTEQFRPHWDRWTDFGLDRTAAMEVDSLTATRPIEYEVVSPEEAEGMFDLLTYEKGAAVVRMLEQYLGEDEFRAGIRKYLADNAYGNTETTDLWDALEAATGQPVRHIADTWIFQGGYPLLTCDVVDGTTLRVHQERFAFAGSPPGPDTRWAVPVVLRYGAGGREAEARLLVDERQEQLALDFAPEWVHLNVAGSGFYRVRYTAAQLDALGRRLHRLTPLERYQLLDDAQAAVQAGSMSTVELLGFVRHFADEPDLSVWQRITSLLGTLDRIAHPGDRPRLEALVRALVAPALTRLGEHPADGEPERVGTLRATLFEALGVLGADTSVLARARALHAAYEADAESVDPDLVAAAVNVIADRGDHDDFVRFRDRFRAATTPQEELRYLWSLPRFRDRASFEELLELALVEVRTQNAPFALGRALANRELGPVAWEFVRRRWDDINDAFPTSTITRLLDGLKSVYDDTVARDVQAFFAEHALSHGARTLEQQLERLEVNVALRAREAATLGTALP